MTHETCNKCGKWKIPEGKTINDFGFKIVDYHRAILFKTIEQHTLAGETKKEHKGRLSFFKLLSLKKGNVASNFEDIIIAIRK